MKYSFLTQARTIYILFVFALVGCVPNNQEQDDPYATPSTDVRATLIVYDFGDTNDRAIREAAIERFNKRFPNVTVELQFSPISTWSDYLQKLITQIAGGSTPDLIHLSTEGVRLAVDKKLVRPLDEFISADSAGQALIADVAPSLTRSHSVDGKQYFLPAAWNNMMIYYNTRVFDEAGIDRPSEDWTWDEFLSLAQQLTTGEGPNKRYGFTIPYFNFALSSWFYSNETSQLSSDMTASNLNDPNMIEAVQFIRDLVHLHKVAPDPFSTDPNSTYQLFSSGNFAMTGGGHWPMQFFMANNFTDYDILPWPQNKTKGTVFGTDGWGIATRSKQPALAWELIKEFISIESLMATTEIGVAIPARRSVAESEQFLAYPTHATLFYESLEYGRPVAAPANFNELESIFMRHLDQVMANEQSAEEAMLAAHEELNAALSR